MWYSVHSVGTLVRWAHPQVFPYPEGEGLKALSPSILNNLYSRSRRCLLIFRPPWSCTSELQDRVRWTSGVKTKSFFKLLLSILWYEVNDSMDVKGITRSNRQTENSLVPSLMTHNYHFLSTCSKNIWLTPCTLLVQHQARGRHAGKHSVLGVDQITAKRKKERIHHDSKCMLKCYYLYAGCVNRKLCANVLITMLRSWTTCAQSLAL